MAPDRKFKSSRAMNLRCPMFITCQSDLDFGDAHSAAMEVRLRKFHFRTLKSPPVAGVQTFLKEHAMDCIVWATKVAVTPDDELPRPSTETCRDDEPFGEEEEAGWMEATETVTKTLLSRPAKRRHNEAKKATKVRE